jgi:hypothetical protein
MVFQIFAPEEAVGERSTAAVAGITAEENIIQPHHRATSKPRQEGFEPSEEEAREFQPPLTEHKSGSSAVHRASRSRAVRKEKQTGVRNSCNIVQLECYTYFKGMVT